jgi:hypothetical protein
MPSKSSPGTSNRFYAKFQPGFPGHGARPSASFPRVDSHHRLAVQISALASCLRAIRARHAAGRSERHGTARDQKRVHRFARQGAAPGRGWNPMGYGAGLLSMGFPNRGYRGAGAFIAWRFRPERHAGHEPLSGGLNIFPAKGPSRSSPATPGVSYPN